MFDLASHSSRDASAAVPAQTPVQQWSGVRDVGRDSVSGALHDGRNPLIVVGGQSEMFLSQSWPREVAVYRGHRGFVRMAIQHGVPLVPVFSFGEHKLMDNVSLPGLQAWFKAKLGFPIPFFPYGRLGLPLSRRTPVTVVVGRPVHPRVRSARPSSADVADLHSRFYAELAALFERNKARYGMPDAKLVFHPK